jgi:hypothetical protein
MFRIYFFTKRLEYVNTGITVAETGTGLIEMKEWNFDNHLSDNDLRRK